MNVDLERLRLDTLSVISFPDPRLRVASAAVTEFGEPLARLAQRMLELMRAERGIGLAAPQVGVNLRLFVMNATGEPADDCVYVNPELHDLSGHAAAEEGCLSLPDIRVNVRRALRGRIRAYDVTGAPFEQEAEALPCRCWQHEIDHLNGVLIIDRMGPADKVATKRQLQQLSRDFQA